MRGMLADISSLQMEEWSRNLVVQLTSAGSLLGSAGVVALFGGLKTEPDLLPLLPWLQERGRRTVFFAVGENGEMRPHLVRHAGELVTGLHGVLMPDVSLCSRVDAGEIDVVLVPGLAFSVRDGARLGRGKGYYDRVLAQLRPDAGSIGAGFSAQMIEFIPREPHDRCVQALVSEEGWSAVQ